MALTDDNGVLATMPVAPAYGGNGGFGNGFGNDWGWIILLLLFANGGWGNGFGGGMWGMDGIYPWMNQANLTSNGFQTQATNSAISALQNSVTSGFGDVQNSLCGGFANVTASVNNGFAQAEIAENARQMANMNQMFGISQQLAQCCCDNRLATAQTQALVQSENCADRQALSDGIRDIIASQTSGVQRILDQMCNDKIDAKNERIADLERQLTMANLSASQTAQTAQILADNNRQTVALEQYLNPVPIPAYVVANPNCCNQNTCGCGCNF